MNKKHMFDDLMADIASNKIKYMDNDSTFNFKCNFCGMCCFNTQFTMTPFDILEIMADKKIRSILGVTTTNDLFRKKLVTLVPGHESNIPLATPVMQEEIIGQDKITKCAFLVPMCEVTKKEIKKLWRAKNADELRDILRKNNTPGKPVMWACSLGKVKPLICAAAPIGRVGIDGEMKYIYSKPSGLCKADQTDKTHTLKDWLSKNNLMKRYNESTVFLKDIVDYLVSAGIASWSQMDSIALGAFLYNWDMCAEKIDLPCKTELFLQDRIGFFEYMKVIAEKFVARKRN